MKRKLGREEERAKLVREQAPEVPLQLKSGAVHPKTNWVEYWAKYGDLFYEKGLQDVKDFHETWWPAVSKANSRRLFAETAAVAMENCDVEFFARAAAALASIKRFREGKPHDLFVLILTGAYGRCVEELIFERHGEDAPNFVPHLDAILERCQADPRWPRNGDQRKYAREVLDNFRIPFIPSKGGRPKTKTKPVGPLEN